MKKETLLSTFLLTGFISQSAAFSAVPEFYKHKDIFYRYGETLIASPGGHGGGKKTKEQQQKIDEAKAAAKKAAKQRINSKIEEFGKKATNIDPNANFQEWADQLIQIKDRISALKDFLDEIQVFIDYSIKKYYEISGEYNDGNLSIRGQVMLLEYVGEFKKISERSKELGLTTNDEIKNLLKSLDSDFGEFAESLLN